MLSYMLFAQSVPKIERHHPQVTSELHRCLLLILHRELKCYPNYQVTYSSFLFNKRPYSLGRLIFTKHTDIILLEYLMLLLCFWTR